MVRDSLPITQSYRYIANSSEARLVGPYEVEREELPEVKLRYVYCAVSHDKHPPRKNKASLAHQSSTSPMDTPSTPQEYQAAPGVSSSTTASGNRPAADPWAAFPQSFRPVIAPYHPAVVDEHSRMISSLLSASPNNLRLPAIYHIPTSRVEILEIFTRICAKLWAYQRKSRKVIITITHPTRFTLDHIFLALTIFRHPSNLDRAVYNLAEMIKRMVEAFRGWVASWNAEVPLASCEYPELTARELREDAKKILERGSLPDLERRWLNVLLRALGDIPELWGFQSSPEDRSGSNSAPQHAPSNPSQPQAASSFDQEATSVDNGVQTGPGVNSDVIGASQSQPDLASGYVAAPGGSGGQVPATSDLKFFQYDGPTASEVPMQDTPAVVPQSSPNTVPSAASGPLPPPSAAAIPRGSSDSPARLGQYRDLNGSRRSLPATSLSARYRAPFPSPQQKVSRLAEILQIERERISLMEHERDIAQGLANFFYRGLFTQYTHVFMASELCEPYRAAILRAPNAMVPMVIRICEHMHRDLAILCELDKA